MNVLWPARQGPVGADLQVARAGCRSRCEMAYFAFFFFFIPLFPSQPHCSELFRWAPANIQAAVT